MDLLIHQGALGDWVLTWPILRALAAEGPVLAVTGFGKAQLAARAIPGVEAVNLEQPDFAALHVEGGCRRISAALRARLAGLARVVSFVSAGHDAWADNLRRLAPQARCWFVDPRPPADWPGHVVAWYQRQLAEPPLPLGEGRGEGPVLPPLPLGEGIALHPGSGGRAKCWPLDRFESVLSALLARGVPVTPLLGEVELDTWPADTLARWRQRHGARPLTSLDELYDALAGCALYLGNDSGPSHLAAQLGRPTVALFGPTAPTRWAPLGPDVTILAPPQPAPMTWLDVPAVLAAVLDRLG